MDYKLWILIIVWIGIVLTLVLSFAGFDFISVVSNSMKHGNETLFLRFWEENGCNSTCVRGFPIPEGFQGGDLLIQQRTTDYRVGDILSYQANCICEDDEEEKCQCYDTIIHRLVKVNETHAVFMGDNIEHEYIIENKIEELKERKFVVGKIIFKIPKLGLFRALLNCWFSGCDSLDCIANGNCD